MRAFYPEIFAQVQAAVGAGRWKVVGGTWVEMDMLLPSGESLLRQFALGCAFFEEHFKQRPTTLFLPDTFGYCSQVPQIAKLFGYKNFVSIKISWSLFNSFPHSTFIWEGSDGSAITAHFPPADTYNSDANVSDIVACVSRNKTPDAAPNVLLLYGHGDGGGGPTDEMLQRLSLMQDVDGLAQVSFAGPDEYFDATAACLAANGAAKLPVWRGELYLELHRGTLTSQQQLKKVNRRCEQALHDAEAASALAFVFGARMLEAWRLDTSWKAVLLNQFHDVLPGSCTSEVVSDALSSYTVALSASAAVILEACSSNRAPVTWEIDHLNFSDPTLAAAIFGTNGCNPPSSSSAAAAAAIIAFNSVSAERCELVCVPSYCCSPPVSQAISSNSLSQLVMCRFSPLSLAPIHICVPSSPVSVCKTVTGFLLQHSAIQVHVSNAGVITSCMVWDAVSSLWREGIKTGGSAGKLHLYKDVPLFWDAWDVEFYYESEQLQDITCSNGCIVDSGSLLCSVRFEASIGLSSRAEIVYSLHANDSFVRIRFNVHWNESHSLLRVSFDTSVDADDWLADSQFCVVTRSSRRNTSWDRAKFEAAGHKWVAVREHGMTVAVINDCTYGHSCLGGSISSSLLRSPTHPDPSADRGFHTFNMAFMPSPSPAALELVIAAARLFNSPVRLLMVPSVHADDTGRLPSLELGLVSSCNHVVVDTVKLPFAWAAAKMQFDASSPFHTPSPLASNLPHRTPPPEFVTPPPNSAEELLLQDSGQAVSPRQQHEAAPRYPAEPSPSSLESVAVTPLSASADAVSTPPVTFETPPPQLQSSIQPSLSDSPSQTTPRDGNNPTTPLLHQLAKAPVHIPPPPPPPGSRVIIVRLFEAAGGSAPAVFLRTECR
jgi:alpha-mannosidase